MVGKDSDAEAVDEEVLGLPPVCWEVTCDICGSAFDLGETEKNWTRRLGLTEDALMAMPPFPEEGEKEGGLEEVSLEELLLNRRGIAEGSSESGWSQVGIDNRVLGRRKLGARKFLHASNPTIEVGATHDKRHQAEIVRIQCRASARDCARGLNCVCVFGAARGDDLMTRLRR